MAVTAKVKLKTPVSAQHLATWRHLKQNISRITESIKTQEDFLTSIYVEVSECFPDISFAMSRASVNSDTQIPVLMIN